MFLTLTKNFTRPINQIAQLYTGLLNALAGAERVFIRVWIKESDINKGWGCIFSGKNTKYKVGGCDGTLQKMVINGTSYWSAWVPFSCSTKNCPRDEVSIKSFASSMPF